MSLLEAIAAVLAPHIPESSVSEVEFADLVEQVAADFLTRREPA